MRTVYYVTASLDGYIARPDGDVSWLSGEAEYLPESLREARWLLTGRETYEVSLRLSDSWPFPELQTAVATRQRDFLPSTPDTEVTDDPVAWVRARREEPGACWVLGGGQIAALLAQADLLDEVFLAMQPRLLGQGIRLFAEFDRELPLRLLDAPLIGGLACLRYEAMRD